MSIPTLQRYHKESYPYITPITGTSTGIGFDVARAFFNEGSKQVILPGHLQNAVEDAASKLNTSGSNVAEGRVADRAEGDRINKPYEAAMGKSVPIHEGGSESTWADYETNVRGQLNMTERFYKQTTGQGQKAAGIAPMQQIARDTSLDDMQIARFHPGGVLTESAKIVGYNENRVIDFDDENLPGHFAVWAASKEAALLHERFVWANWDMEEIKNGRVDKRIQDDEHNLKIGVEGLTEKTGGAQF
ncbi:hypothetical protein LX32DRAFT_668024 [Colletotrichum zoysiae]|uniref:Uncharacterized protein n=1 Tax=Colletotrichum zoysiae TaxID=1216348 RepID=A0AAD9H5D0_9PEZI|nr:hypothetical protein LX32DRAFT_668024 [Colletotrichum zoysiae]